MNQRNMINNKGIPTRAFALDLLKQVKLPEKIINHLKKVSEKGLEIANKIKKVHVNIKLVEIGGLLHDIGRSISHEFDHGLIGGKIIREYGFSEELARICETHLLGGLDKKDAQKVGLPVRNYLPETVEEKIICLADKHMKGAKEVTIEERFDKWFERYGKTSLLIKSKKRVKKIQREIENLK